jgi:hypothetical protein
MPDDSSQKAWMISASRLRRRVNLGWWYQEISLPLIALAALTCLTVLGFRYFEVPLLVVHGAILGLAVIAVGVFSWQRMVGRRLTHKDALVRLEADLGLHNALTSAAAGRGAWPDSAIMRPVVKWRFRQLSYPLIAALAFFSLGFLIPVVPASEAAVENQPYTWTRLEEEVARLVEEEVIDEDYAEEIKKRLEDLRKQKAEDWFSASSLEATDSLSQAHNREADRLERALLRVEKSLKKATDPQASREQREQARQQMQEALEGMRNGQMKPNEELLKKLAAAAKNGGEGLLGVPNPDLEKLRERLREMAGKFQKGRRREADPNGLGQGEPNRGPGTSSNLFGETSPDLPLEKFERLDSEKDEEPDPGDLLTLEEIEHEVDQSPKNPITSGTAENEGLGGDRVWKDSLDPDEQKSLKSFFD